MKAAGAILENVAEFCEFALDFGCIAWKRVDANQPHMGISVGIHRIFWWLLGGFYSFGGRIDLNERNCRAKPIVSLKVW
jgi:hypothetical protein